MSQEQAWSRALVRAIIRNPDPATNATSFNGRYLDGGGMVYGRSSALYLG